MVEHKTNSLVRGLANFAGDLITDLEIIKGDTVRVETPDGVIKGVILEDGTVYYADKYHQWQPYHIKEGDTAQSTPSLFHSGKFLLGIAADLLPQIINRRVRVDTQLLLGIAPEGELFRCDDNKPIIKGSVVIDDGELALACRRFHDHRKEVVKPIPPYRGRFYELVRIKEPTPK